jgi:hypothetical protein
MTSSPAEVHHGGTRWRRIFLKNFLAQKSNLGHLLKRKRKDGEPKAKKIHQSGEAKERIRKDGVAVGQAHSTGRHP